MKNFSARFTRDHFFIQLMPIVRGAGIAYLAPRISDKIVYMPLENFLCFPTKNNDKRYSNIFLFNVADF